MEAEQAETPMITVITVFHYFGLIADRLFETSMQRAAIRIHAGSQCFSQH
jgi:hypothetical protein